MTQTGVGGGPMAPARRKERRFPALRNLLVVLVAIAATLGGLDLVYTLYYGFTDGVASGRVQYCGRDYHAGRRTMTLAEVKAFDAPTGLTRLTMVGKAPWIFGDPVSAPVPPDYRPAAGQVCSLWVWLKTGPDSYQNFALSGGP